MDMLRFYKQAYEPTKLAMAAMLVGLIMQPIQLLAHLSDHPEIAAHQWQSRLVIVISSEHQPELRHKAEAFFQKHDCDIADRNLLLLAFQAEDPAIATLLEDEQVKTGLWLIGYDGGIKSHSRDDSLLDRLFAMIDEMPMRQEEMKDTKNCAS